MSSQLDCLSLLFIAVGLSVDCFAVAIGGSVARRTISYLPALRTAFAFGLFQFLMPILGWMGGRTIVGIIADYDHWVAFALLTAVGARMIWESFRSREVHAEGADITKGILLLTLSVATSIDALAVGLSFAFLQIDIISASATIGAVAFVATTTGFILGRKVSELLGKRAKFVGGVILIAIGLKIFLSHVL